MSIDYTIDTNGSILSMNYTEIGGYNGELFVTYDNFGNMADLIDNSCNSVMAMVVDPNNASITQYNPRDIDDPHSYRARQCFIGIEMLPGQDNRVYLQGHLVIPNDWGSVSTNGETTTTTDDTTDKDGEDNTEPCGPLPTNPCAGKAKDYCFSYASIEYIPIGIGPNGKLQYIGQLAECQKERFRSAGFSEKTIFFTGLLGGECFGVMGGSMTCCTPIICPDGSCGLECGCKVNGKWEKIKGGVDNSGRTC